MTSLTLRSGSVEPYSQRESSVGPANPLKTQAPSSAEGKSRKGGRRARKSGVLPISRTKRANLTLPVGRVANLLKRGRYAPRQSAGAPVYLTAVLEYLASELLELSAAFATENKRSRIIPRYIQLVISNDADLSAALSDVVISGGGVIPNIQRALLPKSRKAAATEKSA